MRLGAGIDCVAVCTLLKLIQHGGCTHLDLNVPCVCVCRSRRDLTTLDAQLASVTPRTGLCHPHYRNTKDIQIHCVRKYFHMQTCLLLDWLSALPLEPGSLE